jgi:hypothetical protein
MWRTDDGGSSWTRLPPLPYDDDHLRFATATTGYAWADNAPLDMTTDGGRTWMLLALSEVSALETSGGVVWALAGPQPYPTIWRAPIGTDYWTALTMTPGRTATLDVHGTTAYVTGQQGAGPVPGSIDVLDATTAPTASTHVEPTNRHTPCRTPNGYVPFNPLGVSTDGTLVMACVGSLLANGTPAPRSVYLSSDDARTWTAISPAPEDPADLTATRQAVFAWGRHLDRYANGRWTRVLTGPTDGTGFTLVGFQDDTHGIAITTTGRVELTRDGGLTWTTPTPPSH